MWYILYNIFSALFLFYVILDITWRLWKRKLSFLPSTPNIPWLGSIPYWRGDSHEMYKMRINQATKYNHLYVSWYGYIPVIRIGCVEYVEPLLKSHEVLSKTLAYDILREWLGEGLLISKGSKWKKRRIALTGAFHFSILNDFVEVYQKHALKLVDKLETLALNDDLIEVQWLVSLSLLDVICETAMGVCVNAIDASDADYVRAVRNIKTLLLKRVMNPLFLSKTIYQLTPTGKQYYKCLDTLHNFTIDVINKKIAMRQNPFDKSKEDTSEPYKKKRKVFMDILLDLYEKGEIDVDGIREEVDTFMFEGHDTSTLGLCWTLYEIGRHPEVQERLHEEVNHISSKDCSYLEKIRMLKYTECVIKEALRLHPPVPGFSRRLEKCMVIDNNTIPAGTILNIDCMSLHMNPAYWTQPSSFNPSRFESEEYSKRNPYCYIPFSAGPRNCIGQKFALLEEKVFIFTILSNFHIKSVQTPDEVKTGTDILTYAVNGINIKFSHRN